MQQTSSQLNSTNDPRNPDIEHEDKKVSAEKENELQHSDLLADIAAVEHEQGSPREKSKKLLDLIFEHFGCLSGCSTIAASGDEIEIDRTDDTDGVEAWVSSIRSAALEARVQGSSITRIYGPDKTPQFALVACPIDRAGRDPFGGVAILVRCNSMNYAERVQLHLRSACLQIANVISAKAKARSTVEMSDIARVYARAGQFSSIQEFAFTITNSARERFNCDQAAMGLIRNNKIKVVCVSGLDSVKTRSPGVLKIEQAMGECVDACCPLVAQHHDRWEESCEVEEGMLHQAWRASVNGASVLSIPVDSGDGPAAVVSFRRSGDEPFSPDDVEAARKLLVPLAGAIPLVTNATRPLPSHVSQSIRSVVQWCVEPKSYRKKVFLALAVLVVAWGVLDSRMYRISVPAVVVAKSEQAISAPFDGLVSSVSVRTGDRVEMGQPILAMDTSALELERKELEADLSNAQLRRTSGVAANDPAAASIAQGEIRSIQAQLDLVLSKLNQAVVRAPYAGIIMAPQLAELPGQIISIGEPLMMIAQDGLMSIELRVPQGSVSDLTAGSSLRFASDARPETSGISTLGDLAPSAVIREGQAVFIAEADLPDDQTWLRPGMEGVAMVDVGDRPNWWLAVHKLVDAARLKFWFHS